MRVCIAGIVMGGAITAYQKGDALSPMALSIHEVSQVSLVWYL